MTIQTQSASALARRAHVEALLAAYPDVTPEEHGMLVHYFKREANALDVGMIASNDTIGRGYARFRADHLDRFTWVDLAKGVAGTAVLVLCVGLVMFRAF
ncbi:MULTISPECIES: hypothetical protein [unclassified Sphingomonas]|uniref:hypothetical protein n=1 Tax=Novosphingobium rhizosphaerae TaxID=1551649 RepID=UPI0015CD10B0